MKRFIQNKYYLALYISCLLLFSLGVVSYIYVIWIVSNKPIEIIIEGNVVVPSKEIKETILFVMGNENSVSNLQAIEDTLKMSPRFENVKVEQLSSYKLKVTVTEIDISFLKHEDSYIKEIKEDNTIINENMQTLLHPSQILIPLFVVSPQIESSFNYIHNILNFFKMTRIEYKSTWDRISEIHLVKNQNGVIELQIYPVTVRVQIYTAFPLNNLLLDRLTSVLYYLEEIEGNKNTLRRIELDVENAVLHEL